VTLRKKTSGKTVCKECPTRVELSPAQMSRLMFEARELISMFRDVVQSQTGQDDQWCARVIEEIDAYRAGQGWSPDGFGGES
jgi:hypothetical protein